MATDAAEDTTNSSNSLGISHFQRLPSEALAHVLAAVPQQQRLRSCALVSRTWQRAALAGTTELLLSRTHTAGRSAAATAWLAKHGRGLRSLCMDGERLYEHHQKSELPWLSLQRLQALNLQGLDISCSLSSTPSSDAAPVNTALAAAGPDSAQPLAQLTELTSLVLRSCWISDGMLSLHQQLSALSRLQALVLEDLFGEATGRASDQAGAALAAALSQLTALTRLWAPVSCADAAVVSSLSCLGQLQALTLDGEWCGQAGGPLRLTWTDLPATVTALELNGSIWQLQQSSWQTVGLPQLQQLAITARGVAGADGTRALLAALAQQRQLQSLAVTANLTLPAAEAQCYAALTASSQLTALRITVDGDETSLPALVSSMSGAGQRLPLLQRLQLWSSWFCEGEKPHPSWGMSVQDLMVVLQACPGLRGLQFVPAGSPGDDTGAAQDWGQAAAAAAQLTELVVGGDGVDGPFISQLLVRLTGLLELKIDASDNVRVEELVPLTRLTQLTSLAIVESDANYTDEPEEGGIFFYKEWLFKDKAGPDQPPDVWRRLRQACRDCHRALLLLDDDQTQQLAEAQARIIELEAQLAAATAAAAQAGGQ